MGRNYWRIIRDEELQPGKEARKPKYDMVYNMNEEKTCLYMYNKYFFIIFFLLASTSSLSAILIRLGRQR